MKNLTLPLTCTLTHEELTARAQDHLSALDELDVLLAEKTSWKDRYNDARDHEQALRQTLKTGEETRDVECFEVLSGSVVTTIRSDNGEVVSTRPATDEERQMPLVPEEPTPPHEELKALAQEITGPKRKGRKARVTVVHVPENARQ